MAMNEKDILLSQSIKAGKRIYYIDVKRDKKDDLFLSITESKKVISGEGEAAQVNYEKHKIFLYKEDFDKVLDGLHRAVDYIRCEQGLAVPAGEPAVDEQPADGDGAYEGLDKEIKIDLDF
ncbi:MAG: PUR family DNA/RNA-binding protein [Bacteroides sp.]|nr:PUR family DNA/RNA-binding protein [Bacteroides sp.]